MSIDNSFLKFSLLHNSKLDSIYKSRNGIYPEEFYGDVLYAGLGIGYLPNQHTEEVTSTTIVEIDQEIIDFNQNSINENWNIIHHDIKTFESENKYDIIVLDIWYDPVENQEVFDLVEKYENFLKVDGKIFYLKSILKSQQSIS